MFTPPPPHITNKKLLNIGSGAKPLLGWINLDYPNEWFEKEQKKYKFIPYDIRHDIIPFADNSVDAIYCSHVIEHIENNYVLKFFTECLRVLKKGKVLRISCPDAEFLYHIAKQDGKYWEWRYSDVANDFTGLTEVRNVDYLVREVAAEKLFKFIKNRRNKDYSKQFESLGMKDFLNYIIEDLYFTDGLYHINYWTFDKINEMLNTAGFGAIICSKWSASCSEYMHNNFEIDTTAPSMSLYIDAIK